MPILIISILGFPIWAIWLAFRGKKLERKIKELEANTVPLSEYEEAIRVGDSLGKELIDYKYLHKTDEDLVRISVDKSLIQEKVVDPSKMSKEQLESCMNYFLEHHVNKTNKPQ